MELRTLAGRIARIDEVTAEIQKWVSGRTRDEVSAICEKGRIPAAPLRDALDVLSDPHLHARGFLSVQQTEAGPVALPNSPMRYAGSPLRELGPPPGLGEHTGQVLSELCGLDEAAIAQLRKEGAIGG